MAEIAAPPMAMDPMQGVQTNIVAPAPIPGQTPAAVPVPAPAPPAQEEAATETLYIQNLNEKIKIPVLKASLRGLFKSYGEVLDVVAHGNLRMRGQAFVSFESPEMAKKALKEVRGFPLYSKPMVRVSSVCSGGLCVDAGERRSWTVCEADVVLRASKSHSRGRGRTRSSKSSTRRASTRTSSRGWTTRVCPSSSSWHVHVFT